MDGLTRQPSSKMPLTSGHQQLTIEPNTRQPNTRNTMNTSTYPDVTPALSKYQTKYWEDPEKFRAAQRAKYAKHPDSIKATAKRWQDAHPEYFHALCRLNSKIWNSRKNGDVVQVAKLECQKKMLKDSYKLGLIG